jgi:hypothetical protein
VSVGIDPDRLARLEEERRFLLRSLDDLERERAAGDLEDADYEELRDGYTARAAAVLREIETGRAALPPAKPRRTGRLAAVWVGVAAFGVVAGLLLAQAFGQRGAGDTLTGDIDTSLNTLLVEARGLQVSDPRAAIDTYDEVLKIQPDNVEALTYRGWMLVQVGAAADDRGVPGGEELVARGEEGFDRAIALRSDYADPSCFKAITRFRFYGDAAGAKGPVDACLAADPPQVVLGLVQNLQAEVDAALATTTTG